MSLCCPSFSLGIVNLQHNRPFSMVYINNEIRKEKSLRHAQRLRTLIFVSVPLHASARELMSSSPAIVMWDVIQIPGGKPLEGDTVDDEARSHQKGCTPSVLSTSQMEPVRTECDRNGCQHAPVPNRG
jgi:hypothetical protein